MAPREFFIFHRFLALWLTLALTLPTPALALREIQTVDSGLEEKQLANALLGSPALPPAATPRPTTGLEELTVQEVLDQADDLDRNGQYQEAEKLLRNAIDARKGAPASLSVLLPKLIKVLTNEKPEMAIEEAKRALESFPKEGAIRNALANAQLKLNLPGEAIATCQKTEELLGLNQYTGAQTRNIWVRALLKLNGAQDALRIALGALERFPNERSLMAVTAQVYIDLGDRENALAILTKAESLFPRGSLNGLK